MTDRLLQPADETGGSIPGLFGASAYRLWNSHGAGSPILVAVPHDGRCYSESLLGRMREPEETTARLEDRHISLVASRIASEVGVSLLVAEAPRAMIDLNRSVDDIDWSMVAGHHGPPARHSLSNRRARRGLGLVPRRLPGVNEIWRGPLSREELDARIEQVYHPYHAALGRELQRLRDRWGAALLIDLHSMPPVRQDLAEEPTVEFVIGDRFGASCGHELVATTLQYLGERGRGVAHNRPYAGGYVLDRFGAPVRDIHAMQIEVCRSTYLCANMREPSARLPSVARLLVNLVRRLSDEVAFLGRDRRISVAAE